MAAYARDNGTTHTVYDSDIAVSRVDYVEDSSNVNPATMQVRSAETSGKQVYSDLNDPNSNFRKAIYHSAGLYNSNEINIFDKTYRFGKHSVKALSTAREYLFFTKPDLAIMKVIDENSGTVSSSELSDGIRDVAFWRDLSSERFNIIKSLQYSIDRSDPFIHLLQNQVINTLEVPNISSEGIETPSNMYGVNFTYRGSSEASDDGPEFSLEFTDNKYLDVYLFFRAYEEYETQKHHGAISPWERYIFNKELHDQFSIYKFLVDEDMETILYYGKMFGVYPKSLPRDTFANTTFENGISYTIDFKAAFYDELEPTIITDFNKLMQARYDSLPNQLLVYDKYLHGIDRRPGKAAFVLKVRESPTSNRFVYKLKWKGDDDI